MLIVLVRLHIRKIRQQRHDRFGLVKTDFQQQYAARTQEFRRVRCNQAVESNPSAPPISAISGSRADFLLQG